MATQKSGRTFLMELKETGLANVKAVPRTYDIWIGINKLRGILPRFSFRVPECERGLEALCAYHTVRVTSTGIARDEPCHDASSHARPKRREASCVAPILPAAAFAGTARERDGHVARDCGRHH